jgi:hypothetical protein
MGIGPAPAARKALAKAGMTIDQMDLVEVNEAFSAQYIAVERELGLDRNRTNVDGGADRDRPSARGERHQDHSAPAPRPPPPREAVRPGQRVYRGRTGGGGDS